MKEQLRQGIAEYYLDKKADLFRRANSRVSNPSDAEEVVSEVLFTMLRQVDNGSLKILEDIPRFFTTVLSSRAADFKRNMNKHGVVDDGLESGLIERQQFTDIPSPEELLEKEQEGRVIIELIDEIPNKVKRKILTRYLLHGTMITELSKELNISRQYAHRVIREFKRRD